ncbi:MAG: hypothetical protein ACE5F9_11895 [Phycisphaerae bacterium]
MSYYDAVDTLYGTPRHYTRVLLFNREWLDPKTRVKADRPDRATDVPVFKLNIVEEIPTQNYNYRYMITIFLDRRTLVPKKLAASSQEWCGTTYKQVQWLPDETRGLSFSYFQGEADRSWTLPAKPVPYPVEALFVIARAAAAAGHDMEFDLLPPMRSTHGPRHTPEPATATLTVGRETADARVPFGTIPSRSVTVRCGDRKHVFRVESTPPYRLLSYRSDAGLRMALRYVERRAYWDRSKPSGFYQQGAAP